MRRWVRDLPVLDWAPWEGLFGSCLCEDRFEVDGCHCWWFRARPKDWPEEAAWPA